MVGVQSGWFGGASGTVMFLVVVAWSLVWKGFALWRAGRENSPAWFVVILIVNTFGILEIVYLLFFTKKAIAARASRKGGGDDIPRPHHQ